MIIIGMNINNWKYAILILEVLDTFWEATKLEHTFKILNI